MPILQFDVKRPKTVKYDRNNSAAHYRYRDELRKWDDIWKAKRTKAGIEIRKGIEYASMVVTVHKRHGESKDEPRIALSLNGTGYLTDNELTELVQAVREADAILDAEP